MFWAGQNRLFRETFGKLERWLAAEGYVGSIDVNCIVNETGIYPLESVGFVEEGVGREDAFLDGAYHDTHYYGVLEPEWDR